MKSIFERINRRVITLTMLLQKSSKKKYRSDRGVQISVKAGKVIQLRKILREMSEVISESKCKETGCQMYR